MSIQAQFNEDAIDQLTLVKAFIDKAEKFDADQMKSATIQKIMNCTPALAEMTPVQVYDLEDELINKFKRNGWMVEGEE